MKGDAGNIWINSDPEAFSDGNIFMRMTMKILHIIITYSENSSGKLPLKVLGLLSVVGSVRSHSFSPFMFYFVFILSFSKAL